MTLEKIVMTKTDFLNMVGTSPELYLTIPDSSVQPPVGKVYEVIERSPKQLEGYYLGDFNVTHGCNCGSDLNIQGDYILVLGGVSFTDGFHFKGLATPYQLKENTPARQEYNSREQYQNGTSHLLLLHMPDKVPTEKVQASLLYYEPDISKGD